MDTHGEAIFEPALIYFLLCPSSSALLLCIRGSVLKTIAHRPLKV